MSINAFGVTSANVAAHYFPTIETFSTSTLPTTATVLEMVNAVAAELNGRLAAAGVTASEITNAATPAAYAWCADTVRLGAAVRATWAMAGEQAPDEWELSLAARFKSLEDIGYLVLGDAPAPSTNPNGPASHVSTHDLDTGDSELISSVIPQFRRDDRL